MATVIIRSVTVSDVSMSLMKAWIYEGDELAYLALRDMLLEQFEVEIPQIVKKTYMFAHTFSVGNYYDHYRGYDYDEYCTHHYYIDECNTLYVHTDVTQSFGTHSKEVTEMEFSDYHFNVIIRALQRSMMYM